MAFQQHFKVQPGRIPQGIGVKAQEDAAQQHGPHAAIGGLAVALLRKGAGQDGDRMAKEHTT